VQGIIGIGLLGSAIAERLQLAGLELFGWDVDSGNLERASAAGHVKKLEPCRIAATCDRIVLCLPNSGVVESVVAQIEDDLQPGAMVIDTTTGSPAAVERVAERLAQRKVTYLDACIGGSSEDVRRHRAMVLCGGPTAAFAACQPMLDAIAPQVYHMGAVGTGTRMKLVFNLVLGLNRAVLAEGLMFAAKSGIGLDEALDVLQHGAAYSRVMDTKGRKMIDDDFAPQARLSQHLKDVRHILEEGAASGAMLPLSGLHAKLLEEVERAGYGADDNSAIVRWFKGLC